MLGGDLIQEIRELANEQDRLYELWEERARIAAEEEAAIRAAAEAKKAAAAAAAAEEEEADVEEAEAPVEA